MLPPFTTSEEFRALRERPEPWLDGLRWIVARHGLGGGEWSLLPGGSNVAFANTVYVVKLYAPRWLREFEAERVLLGAVEGRLAIPTPPLEAAGRLAQWGYVVMGRLRGRAAVEVWPSLASAERASIARELGRALAGLHALRVPALDALGPAWTDELQARLPGWAQRQREQGAGELWIERAREVLERQSAWLRAQTSVPVHADVTDDHVLLVQHDGSWQPSGFIDFADALLAPPEHDLLGPCTHWFPDDAASQGAFLDGYGLPAARRGADLAERFLALALLHRFVRLPHMARRLTEPAPHALDALLREIYAGAFADAGRTDAPVGLTAP